MYDCHNYDIYIFSVAKNEFLSPGKGNFSRARILSGVTFSCGLKNYWSIVFLNFNITFLATWGCASDFSEMLPKFKMAARGQL